MSKTKETSQNESTRVDQQKSLIALSYNIVGTMLPLLISILFVVFFSFYTDLLNIVDRGDLFIYSAGLYTAAIISFMNNKKSLRLRDRKLYHVSYLLALISSISFAAFLLRDSIQMRYAICIPLNYWFIRISSIALIGFSIYVLKTAIDYEFINTPPESDPQNDEVQRTKTIAEEL